MELDWWLIRHADAEAQGPDGRDFSRPLSEAGRAGFAGSVRGLGALECGFDRIYHSPLVRAEQTAEILDPLGEGRRESLSELAQEPGPGLLAAVGGRSVALVGHEPWMGELCAWLIGGDDAWGRPIPFKKGAVAWLRGRPVPGGMRLRAFLPPKVLRALDRS